jgi:transposase-like protein
VERALGAELSEHLGYEKGDRAGRGSGNSRNGYSSKTVIGDDGALEIGERSRIRCRPDPMMWPLLASGRRRSPRGMKSVHGSIATIFN